MLISRLSFTHLVELVALEDNTKRAFYEVECIRGNWSVRELKQDHDTVNGVINGYYPLGRMLTCLGVIKPVTNFEQLGQ
jgi:hypothetical protein